ncbi:MAG: hypothetical protein V4648_05245 [Bacteroidota bacterium]
MPKELKENSGIVLGDASHFWTINDSGNANEVYQIDTNGTITNTIEITNLENNDWEDITKDDEGALYIGDFGNNDNTRNDLGIYKIAKTDLTKTAVTSVQKTTFVYPEQESFPPKKKNLLYDCEAFFELDGHFYLFTKNRSKGFDGTTLLYKIPNREGHFNAQLLGSYKTCDDYATCSITSAAISPNKKQIVLLSHSKLWLIENFKDDDFLNGTITELPLNHNSQKEGICFKDNDKLIITDERVKKKDGKLYEVSLQQLKTKP